jgi:hypothetical protein
LPLMHIRDLFRNVFSARPVTAAGEELTEPGAARAAEESTLPSPDDGAADIKRMEKTVGGAAAPGIASSAAAEAAEAQIESQEAPPEQAP